MPSATTLMERSRERKITDLTMDLEPALVTNSRTNEPSILMLSGKSFCTQVTKASARVTADALDALGRGAEATALREKYGIVRADKN